MKTPDLKDFERWKTLNRANEFSIYDYIFHMNKQNSDVYFAFLELFWPSFIIYKEYVFLKENFSEKKLEDLINQNEKIEFWMNLLIVDPYFENEINGEERAESLAKSLVEMWQAKLNKDFPSKNFIVKYLCDKECGDYGLTFYQV